MSTCRTSMSRWCGRAGGGVVKTKSRPFPSSQQGRHLLTVYAQEWSITNTHAESGGRTVRDRDERAAQLVQMSRQHESADSRGVCVLAGDFNIRLGEEDCLWTEGWRDAQLNFASEGQRRVQEDEWTWRRGASSGRYDRVFVHGGADAVECERFSRLTSIWPARSDHVALLVVLRRKSGAALPKNPPAAAGLSAAASPSGAPASSRTGSLSAAGQSEELKEPRHTQTQRNGAQTKEAKHQPNVTYWAWYRTKRFR